jgi:hypothetical protein
MSKHTPESHNLSALNDHKTEAEHASVGCDGCDYIGKHSGGMANPKAIADAHDHARATGHTARATLRNIQGTVTVHGGEDAEVES